jgi:hypothetical protein
MFTKWQATVIVLAYICQLLNKEEINAEITGF